MKLSHIQKTQTVNFNFDLYPNGQISKHFIDLGLRDFISAANFIKGLPYRRNKIKADLSTVFFDRCGTCSTKHAVLKQVCIENNIETVRLILGIFKMNKLNTPGVALTLEKYELEYIPEAHTYLTIGTTKLDCTKTNSLSIRFAEDLLSEIEIEPTQIADFKVNYHKDYLKSWLSVQTTIKYSLTELWAIREQCIEDLSAE